VVHREIANGLTETYCFSYRCLQAVLTQNGRTIMFDVRQVRAGMLALFSPVFWSRYPPRLLSTEQMRRTIYDGDKKATGESGKKTVDDASVEDAQIKAPVPSHRQGRSASCYISIHPHVNPSSRLA
jgi:hypothetical protein